MADAEPGTGTGRTRPAKVERHEHRSPGRASHRVLLMQVVALLVAVVIRVRGSRVARVLEWYCPMR